MAFSNPTEDHMLPVRRNYPVNAFHGYPESGDALVLLQKYPWVYTSPNIDVIPIFDPEPVELRARRDGRFGLEDYVCHPQGHSEDFPWAPVVPRKPTTIEAMRAHPYQLLWYDVLPSDWVQPRGCAFTNVGTLDLALYTEMFVKAVEINTHAVSIWSTHPVPSDMVTAARSLFTALERLKSLPLSFRDMALQWAQVQRMALDLVAMDSYYGYYREQMIQRDKRQKLNPNLMGCFTTNPAVVDNLFWAGIPVVYVRQETDPNAWHIRTYRVVDDFWCPDDVETGDWWCPWARKRIPCRNIWMAAHGSDRIRMSRPFGRYFEDIVSLPSAPSRQVGYVFPAPPPPATASTPSFQNEYPEDTMPQRTPSPMTVHLDPEPPRSLTPPPPPSSKGKAKLVEPGGVQKLSRAAKKKQQRADAASFIQSQAPGSSSAAQVFVPLHTPKELRAFNHSKWEVVKSPILPGYSVEWTTALDSVNRYRPLHNFIPLSLCGNMFPDPGYFAAVTRPKLEACVVAWLYTRASRCGQMLHPFQGDMPVANAATWRLFFSIWSLRHPEPSQAPMPSTTSNRQPHIVEHMDDALEAARAMFGPELVETMHLETSEVHFHNVTIPVVQGRAQNLRDPLLRRITWELAELNWRYELLALDRVAARDCWRGEESSDQRMEMVLDVFKPGRDVVWWNSDFPTVSPSITGLSIGARLPALLALRRLMCAWFECPQDIQTSYFVNPLDTSSVAYDFERRVLLNYCDSFYAHFGRPPIIPMLFPMS